MSESIRDCAVIAGVGMTALTRESGRTVLDLALEAIQAALDDAGLSRSDIDGVITYRVDDSIEAVDAAVGLGLPGVCWYQEMAMGGAGGVAAVLEAAMAIRAGLAGTVVVFRALNGRSGTRLGKAWVESEARGWKQWSLPYGCVTPPQWFALWARRHMALYGTTSRQLGAVAVTLRDNAQRNPRALFHGRPITIEDHQASRLIADPFRLLDCCLETDGGAAIVVTSAGRAADLRHPAAWIAGAVNGFGPGGIFLPLEWPEMGEMFPVHIADRAFEMAGLERSDVDVALIYDGFTSAVITQLEDLGFVGKGEGGPFVESGAIAAGGSLPVNPNGGMLSEGYVHGMNNLIEAVIQLRGQAGARQVADAEVALVTGGEGARGSVLLLHS